ncbi:MAG: M14 family zinc carboxypeptidase [Gaiellaceae bacterium]|jgi:protein MpaA
MVTNPRRVVALALLLAAVTSALVISSVFADEGNAATSSLTRQLIGRSVRGRAIYAYERGDPNSTPVLVVGSIHGNEPAGIAVAKRLVRIPLPQGIDLWVIPDLNPDGHAANTRGNAHGVDLNRNFPWRWRRLSAGYDSGPHSLSEPEARAAARLIKRVRPRLTIWFHQPLDLVDGSRRSPVLERRFARLAGLPLKQLQGPYPGTATSWERHVIPGAAAFVAELPGGKLGARKVGRYARAVLSVSGS